MTIKAIYYYYQSPSDQVNRLMDGRLSNTPKELIFCGKEGLKDEVVLVKGYILEIVPGFRNEVRTVKELIKSDTGTPSFRVGQKFRLPSTKIPYFRRCDG